MVLEVDEDVMENVTERTVEVATLDGSDGEKDRHQDHCELEVPGQRHDGLMCLAVDVLHERQEADGAGVLFLHV